MMMGVKEAAEKMGVGEERVRELIHEGRLNAQKVGQKWVIEDSELASKVWVKSAGRPLSPKSAMALAQELEGNVPSELSSVEKYRLRKHARNILAHRSPKSQLRSWFAARAQPLAFVISRADIPDFRKDPRIRLSGVSDPRSGLLPGNEVEAYIAKEFLLKFEKEWFLVPTSSNRKANVILRVVDELPSEVPAIFSAMDLAERPGSREQAASDLIIKGVLNGS